MKKKNFRICSDGSSYWIEKNILFLWWEMDELMNSTKSPHYYSTLQSAETSLDRYLSVKNKVVKTFD